MSKKYFILAAVFISALFIAGCYHSSTSSTGSGQASSPSTSSGPTAGPSEVSPQPRSGEAGQAPSPISPPDLPDFPTPAETLKPPEIKEFIMTAESFKFTPSEIVVNKGDIVRLKIISKDTAHGFAIKDYGIKENLEPGKETVINFTADKAGTFTFFCSVFCGKGHKDMKGTMIVK